MYIFIILFIYIYIKIKLQSRIIELIDTKYKDKIDFSNQQDSFMK